MSCYDKLLETKVEPFRSICEIHERIDSLPDDDINTLIRYIFNKIIIFYNKKGWFGDTVARVNNNINIWKECLSDLIISDAFLGLNYLLSGKTKYIDLPPSSVIQFMKVCLDAKKNGGR